MDTLHSGLQGYIAHKSIPLGPYRRPLPRVAGGTWGGGRFLMGEVPLYGLHGRPHSRTAAGAASVVIREYSFQP